MKTESLSSVTKTEIFRRAQEFGIDGTVSKEQQQVQRMRAAGLSGGEIARELHTSRQVVSGREIRGARNLAKNLDRFEKLSIWADEGLSRTEMATRLGVVPATIGRLLRAFHIDSSRRRNQNSANYHRSY